MSRKINLFLFAVLLSGVVFAGDVVVNGEFALCSNGIPMMWELSKAKEGLKAVPDNGGNCVEYACDNENTVLVRQYSITLVPGEKYRIEMDLEADNLEYMKLWCVVANHGWDEDCGIKLKPGKLTTNGIQHYKEEIVMPASLNNIFSVAFYMYKAKGRCRLHRVSLVPLTEAAEKGSVPCFNISMPIISVLTTNRMGLPQEMKELPLYIYGVDDKNASLHATIDGKTLPPIAIVNNRAFLNVNNYRKGEHKASLKAMANGKTVVEREFSFAYAEPLPEFKAKRSGMTEELLIQDINGRTEFSFVNPRDGWCYIGIGKEGAQRMAAMLDDTLELFPKGYTRNETMRDISRGVHKIKLAAPAEGRIVVRAVPMSYKYAGVCPTISFPGMCDYTWEWNKKHALGYTANFGEGNIRGEAVLDEIKAFGISTARRFNIDRSRQYSKAETEKFLQELQSSPAINEERTTFVDLDEFDWSDYSVLLDYAECADRLHNVRDKKIITSIASQHGPTVPGIHHYLLEQMFNVGKGRGYIFFENYYGTDDTEEQAVNKIKKSFDSIIKGMEEYMPGSMDRIFFSFSNMCHPTYITSALHANVNFKYYMDLEMNMVANSEFGNKLYSIGFWGCHYADEDVNIWTQKLFKHYLAEGRTDMLSKQYGYTYYLPYLANGEFKKGFEGWERTGESFIEVIRNFSRESMRHWDSKDESDTVAVMSPGATLKTNAVKLMPGQKYKLEYVTADYEDVKKNICDPKPVPISAELGNANVIQKWDCVDRSKWSVSSRENVPRIHYYVTHFQPNADTMPLTFTCGGKEGKHYTLNFIKIEPLCE